MAKEQLQEWKNLNGTQELEEMEADNQHFQQFFSTFNNNKKTMCIYHKDIFKSRFTILTTNQN